MKKRIEFSKATKTIAAEKVAFLCSNPECKRFTVASDDKGRSHRYGEAAHIYAAANGGPRANPAMSIDQLKSEANCLWLCNSCHELIDANPNRYNPELLKEWKSSAEARAMDLVQSQDRSNVFIAEIEHSSGLRSFFDGLFLQGDFKKISHAIRYLSGKDGLTKEDADEVSFAQTRFDAFCARKNLETNLSWVSKAAPELMERLTDFAIESFDSELCSKVALYSNDLFKRELANKIGQQLPFEGIIQWAKSSEGFAKDDNAMRSFQIVGAVFSKRVAVDEQGHRISCRKGWLLEMCDSISSFVYDSMKGHAVDEERLRPISDKLNTLSWLDPYYIARLFDGFVDYFPKGRVFEALTRKMIDIGISTPLLRIHYFAVALTESQREKEVGFALGLGKKYSDSRLLLYVLSYIGQKQPLTVIKFVEENLSTAKRDLYLIGPYYDAKKQASQPFDLLEFLDQRYEGEKNENYHLLRAFALDEKGEMTECTEEWKAYKRAADINADLVSLALRMAVKCKDEEFVTKVCRESQAASSILESAQIIYDSFPSPSNIAVAVERLKDLRGQLPPYYNRLMFALLLRQNRLEEALPYGEKVYSEEGAYDICPYLLQVRLELGRYEEDDLVRAISASAHDAETLYMLGELYRNAGNEDKGWNLIARSVALERKADAREPNLLVRFADCDRFQAMGESNDYSYVKLSNRTSFLLLPPNEQGFFGENIFEAEVYYSDRRKDLCFLSVGDTLEFGDETVTIQEVWDYLYFFHAKAMEALVLSPAAIGFHADNPEEVVAQLSDYFIQAKKQQDEFLASTSGMPLPFCLFQKQFGRGVFAAAEALYYSDKRKSFFCMRQDSSPQKPTLPSRPVFDAESFYLAYRLGINPETIRKASCCMPVLTKGMLLNEIVQKEKDFGSPKECGTLAAFGEDNTLGYHLRTKQERRGALQELKKMRDLLDCFEVATPSLATYTPEQDHIISSLRENSDDRVDAELLEALWSGETLVSNNGFLHVGAYLGKGKVMDFSDFLAVCPCSAKEGINAVIGLQRTNIVQYITPDVFSSLVEKIQSMDEGPSKEDAIQAMLKLINGETDGADQSKNRYIVYLASIDERRKTSAPAEIVEALKKLSDDLTREYLANYYRPFVGDTSR